MGEVISFEELKRRHEEENNVQLSIADVFNPEVITVVTDAIECVISEVYNEAAKKYMADTSEESQRKVKEIKSAINGPIPEWLLDLIYDAIVTKYEDLSKDQIAPNARGDSIALTPSAIYHVYTIETQNQGK